MLRITIFLTVALQLFLGCSTVPLNFSARNLPPRDIGEAIWPDAYIIIYYAPNATAPIEYIGMTDNISDNSNPDWPELFWIPSNGNPGERLKIDMYDSDWPSRDDYMGFVEILYSDLLNSEDGIFSANLLGGIPEQGQLIFRRQDVN